MNKKHIVLTKNTIEMNNDLDLEKVLSINWGTTTLVPSAPKSNFWTTVQNTIVDPFRQGWRLPWDMLDKKDLYKMNYHVTISPDPIHETDFYSRKVANKVLRQFLLELKKNMLFDNIICVYEYGTRGKKYGKLHWHILFKTRYIRKIEEVSNRYFATSKSRARHTTVIKRIRIDKTHADSSDEVKVENYKQQIDYIMQKYMQKETQNKTKCLYTNLIKK